MSPKEKAQAVQKDAAGGLHAHDLHKVGDPQLFLTVVPVSVVYCYVTSYLKHCGLKQLVLTHTVSVWQELRERFTRLFWLWASPEVIVGHGCCPLEEWS